MAIDKEKQEKDKQLKEASEKIVADIFESAKHVAAGEGRKLTIIRPVSSGIGETFDKIEANNRKLMKYENDAARTAKMLAANVILKAKKWLHSLHHDASSVESKNTDKKVTTVKDKRAAEKEMDFAYSIVKCAQKNAIDQIKDEISEKDHDFALRRVASDIIKEAIEDAKTLVALTRHGELAGHRGHRNSIALYGTEREGPIGMTFHKQPLPHLDSSISSVDDRIKLPVLHHGLSPKGSDSHLPFKPGETPWKIQKSQGSSTQSGETAEYTLSLAQSSSSTEPLSFVLPSKTSASYVSLEHAHTPPENVELKRPPPFKPYHDPVSYRGLLPEHEARLPRLRFNELPGNHKFHEKPKDNKSVKVGMVCPRALKFNNHEVMTNSLYTARKYYRSCTSDCNDWDQWTSIYRSRSVDMSEQSDNSGVSGRGKFRCSAFSQPRGLSHMSRRQR